MVIKLYANESRGPHNPIFPIVTPTGVFIAGLFYLFFYLIFCFFVLLGLNPNSLYIILYFSALKKLVMQSTKIFYP